MVDFGSVMGALGLASGIIAILYTRMQAGAARIQAQETAHMSTLQSNSELLERSREIRRRVLAIPAIREEFLSVVASQPPLSELVDLLQAEGGVERYLVYRDAMDTAQDAFFLRLKGVITDEHWYVWTNAHMSIWAKFPGFEKNFHVAAQTGLIHPEFVKFYEPIFRGSGLRDPATCTANSSAI